MGKALLPEFDQEMATTRRLLERVPSDRGAWKPHPKSFALGHLAQLVAGMPGWITQMLKATELDLAAAPAYSLQTTEARAALDSARDPDFDVPWSLWCTTAASSRSICA